MQTDYYFTGRKKIGFLSLCRDIFIAKLPVRLRFITRRFLPYEPDFIFFTHPRNKEDIYATIPLVKQLERFLPAKLVRAMLRLSPCFVVASIQGPEGKKGYVVSVTELPETLFASRERTGYLIKESINFFKKISSRKVYVGLAAWWPIVSNSGLLFKRHLEGEKNIRVTSGHTVTLISLYLSLLKLCDIGGIAERDAKILIVGAGKIGGALAELLGNKVAKIGLVDKNAKRIQFLTGYLSDKFGNTMVEPIPVNDGNLETTLVEKVAEYDVTACTTSNIGLVVKDSALLKNCVILDDSRPEAFPRICSAENNAVVLEGGLMKVPSVVLDSDFGFGREGNIFGCLCESVILALDGERTLSPNVGEVDFDNLFKFIKFCNKNNIVVGDFKCGHRLISSKEIASLFLKIVQTI